jgi:Zn-dependent protease
LVDGAFIVGLVLRLPVVLFSLTIHEFMHAWTAYKCGDDTAYRMGRVTLNPLPHLDLIGTLALMFAPIGWAKPVPINPANFDYQTRKRSEALVSVAGVAANFCLAAMLALVARVLVWQGVLYEGGLGEILWRILALAVIVNFGLGIFNLLPIFPLDGSHLARLFLPLRLADRYMQLRRYGIFLLLGIVLLNRYTGLLIWPILGLIRLLAGAHGADAILWYAFGAGT